MPELNFKYSIKIDRESETPSAVLVTEEGVAFASLQISPDKDKESIDALAHDAAVSYVKALEAKAAEETAKAAEQSKLDTLASEFVDHEATITDADLS